MTTTTNKDKLGKRPLSQGKQGSNQPNQKNSTLSQEELKRRQDYALALAKASGRRLVPFKGAIIQIPEGTLF